VDALDLPHPRRAAACFAALAAAALCLELDPRLPWIVGLLAVGLFGCAGAIRTVQEERELRAVRRSADALILHTPTSRDASELVRWRSAELTSRAHREQLGRDIARTLRALDPARMPSASPLRRPDARSCRPLLDSLAERLLDERPVAARGILLTQSLLRDSSSPLYCECQSLDHALRRALGALEP
jgi:hypothetical protein